MAEDLNKAVLEEVPDLSSLPTRVELERAEGSETPPAKSPEESPTPPESSPEGEAASGGGQEETIPSTEGEAPKSEEAGTESKTGEEGGETPKKEEGGETPKKEEGAEETKHEAPVTAEQQNAVLSEMTGGRVENAVDMVAVLDHYEELLDWEKKVNDDPSLILPEGKARAAYTFVMKQPGENFKGSVQKFYHVQGLGDVKDLSPKEAQFEAYMLREENADLSREEGKTYFDEKYKQDYGESLDGLKEDNPLLYREHEVATNLARKTITDMQAELQSETTESNQDGKQYSQEEYDEFAGQVDQSMDDYAGISVAFSSDAKPEDRVNFVLNQDEANQLSGYLKDPGSWWDDLLAKHVDEQGNFDTNGYRDAMVVRTYPEKFAEIMYNQGFERGKIANEADIKQTSTEEVGVTPVPDKGSLYEEWAKAMDAG